MPTIADTHVTVARSFRQRLVGLLGRRALPEREALLLMPCSNIHTAFMAFAIDAVFLDRDGTIVALHRQLRPWRIAAARGADACLELSSGSAQRLGLEVGQRLPQLARTALRGVRP